MEGTGISWTDNTFNGWIGCTKVSAGCAHCYAEIINKRCGQRNWGVGAVRRVTSEVNWQKPLKWDREAARTSTRIKVFCSSMADVFDKEAPAAARERLFELIKATPNLDWQLLTKRPENLATLLPNDWGRGYENAWLGVTIENRRALTERIPLLRMTPAAVRFLSCEPLLEDLGLLELHGIHWVIVGGESGVGARSFEIEWATSIINQCRVQGVAVFVKQLGAKPHHAGDPLTILSAHGTRDRHAGDPAMWPAALRELALRQFPLEVTQ